MGRHQEVGWVLDALERAPGGALVRGVAGVGKTALLGAVVDHVGRDGGVVELTAGTAAGAATPFAPFLYLLDEDDPPSQTTAEQLVRLAARLRVRAGEGRPVLLVDDAHLLDGASVQLVHHLVTREPIRVVLAARTSERLPDDVVGLVKDGHLLALDLQPLVREDCAALVSALLDGQAADDVYDEIWRVSEGNPLFVRELVSASIAGRQLDRDGDGRWQRHGALAASTLLWEVISRRLAALDDESRRFLDALSVAGPLRMVLAEELIALDRLSDLERSGLTRTFPLGEETAVDVGHPLYAEISRDHEPEARLQEARRRVADAIGVVASGRGDDLLLEARLRLDAGEEAPNLYAAAAQQAFTRLDGPFALRCAEAAAGERPDAHVLRASALGMVGRYDEARAVFETLRNRTSDPEDRAGVVFQQAQYLLYHEGSVGAAADALRTAIEDLPPGAAAPLQSYLGWVTFLGGDPVGATAVADPLLAEPSVPVTFGGGPAYTSAQAVLGRPASALPVVERAFAEIQSLDFGAVDVTVMAVNFMWIRILCFWQLGRATEADNPFAPFDPVVAARLEGAAIWRLGMRATQAFVRGHLAAGIRGYEALGPELRTAPLPISVFNSTLLATMYAQHGDLDAARDQLAFVDETIGPELAVYHWWVERARLLVRAVEGDVPGAVADALALADRFEQEAFSVTTSLHDVVRLGRADLVGDRLIGQAHRPGATWWDRACAAHARALATADADGLFSASRTFAAAGLCVPACEAAAQAAALWEAGGDRLRAAAAARRVGELDAAIGGLRTPAVGEAPKGLTEREHLVARLAAGGATNKEIAQHLGTSPRTVGNQLQRVYEKLGVHTRAQLAEFVDLS